MDHRRNRSRSRSRSRSNSPPSSSYNNNDRHNFRRDNRDNGNKKMDREQLERERRERMARLRAENDAESRGVVTSSADSANKPKGDNNAMPSKNQYKKNKNANNNEDDEELDDEQRQMMEMMGFGGFGTTKGKAVEDNQSSAARGAASKNKGRKYRQYMNRKGGFNRPLDKMT